ncbi:MAG: hypothetical protein JNL98_02190 [Bryobacterales bacterium]|nr:hypothetical protein [Bryobacterales bacterium]
MDIFDSEPKEYYMAIRSKAARRNAAVAAGAATERLSDPKAQERLTRALARWESRTKPLVEAVRSSEHLTQKDFAIRINTKA